MTPREILSALARPFPADAVSWRAGPVSNGRTKPLAYIDARDVQARLDEVMGADWQCEFVPMANGTCCCRIGLKIDGEWRWRANGAGASDIEGEKGQYSDALKRAAVMWGVGTYLYNISAPWCEMEGKQIKASEFTKLQALLNRSAKPAQPEPKPMQPSDAEKVVAKVQETFPGAQAKTPDIPAVRPAPATVRDAAGKRTSGEIRATTQAGDRRINPQVSTKCANTMLGRLSYCESAEELAVWDERDGMNHADWGKLSLADQRAVETAYRAKKAQLSAAPAHDPDTGEIDEDAA
jgi:hypothetical protein